MSTAAMRCVYKLFFLAFPFGATTATLGRASTAGCLSCRQPPKRQKSRESVFTEIGTLSEKLKVDLLHAVWKFCTRYTPDKN